MQDAFALLFGEKLPAPIVGALERLLVLDRLNELYDEVRRKADGQPFAERFLETMQVRPGSRKQIWLGCRRAVRWWRLRIIRSGW